MRLKQKQQGFTLLEVLLTMAVLVTLALAGWGSYFNYSSANSLEATSRSIIADLRTAQQKSANGDGFTNWGLHFDGSAGSYQLFSSPTNYSDPGKTIISTTFLTGSIAFSNPTSGQTTDVVFNKISGTAAAATISIALSGNTRNITINAQGLAYDSTP